MSSEIVTCIKTHTHIPSPWIPVSVLNLIQINEYLLFKFLLCFPGAVRGREDKIYGDITILSQFSDRITNYSSIY